MSPSKNHGNVIPMPRRGLGSKIKTWAELVKFSHSIFALPFALSMVAVLSRRGAVSLSQLVLLVVCVVSARTAAMGFNRIVDARIDAENPRTKGREIPTGRVTQREAASLVVGSIVVFVSAAALLGRHCLIMTPLVLAVLLGYSFMKRISSSAHFVLGLALALAPGGVWYALTGVFSWEPIPLMVCVLTWVAGFDILYSCQDEEFDRRAGLKSVPTAIGLKNAIRAAFALHLVTVAAVVLFGVNFHLGSVFYLGAAAFTYFLFSQYAAIRTRGISCIDQVFFTRNGIASVVLFVATLGDAIVR